MSKRILTDKEMDALEKVSKGRSATFSPAEVDVSLPPSRKVISDADMAAMESSGSSEVTSTESALRGAAQGASFGFADEIQGGALGAIESVRQGGSFRDAYEAQRDLARAKYTAAQQANPLSYLGGQVAGGIAGSALTPGAGALGAGIRVASAIGGAGKAASIARGVVGAGVAGAASGALTAAGESEAKTAGGIASDVAGGAGAGAAFGGVLGGVGKLLPGVRGSVSNDFFGNRVLPVTVGAEGAETAKKLLKDPEARNAIVKLANKNTVKTIKDEVRNAIANDVQTFKTLAGQTGQELMMKAEDKFAKGVETFKRQLDKTYIPFAEKQDLTSNPRIGKIISSMEEVLSGRAKQAGALPGVEDAVGSAGVLKELRQRVRDELYKGGNPRDGIVDGIQGAEKKFLRSLEAQTTTLIKKVPEGKLADELYSKASDYVELAQKSLFKKGASGGKKISNAQVESFILGKGTPGKVEDLDSMFTARKDFVQALSKAGKKVSGDTSGVIGTARDVMEFNRLGMGDGTGRALAPLVTMLTNPKLAPFAMAAYNPRMYLRALSQADNLTSEDRKVLSAIVKAVGRQRDIAASKFFSEREGE
jgi:hypothetical protein